MDAAAASPSDNKVVARAYGVAAITYPLWSLIAPGPIDPLGPWLGIGACMLTASIAAARWRLSRAEIADLALLLGSLVTLHFFLLASANDMRPFYAVGSSIAMLATLMNTRSVKAMAAYGAFVAVLIVGLYAAAPNPLKLAYWASPIPTFVFAYRRLRAQSQLEQRLEQQVAQRTQELSATNRRLREEIQTRERLTEALSVQQKVEAVARMAGGIAHDFNNLLSTIGIYAELLSEALPPSQSAAPRGRSHPAGAAPGGVAHAAAGHARPPQPCPPRRGRSRGDRLRHDDAPAPRARPARARTRACAASTSDSRQRGSAPAGGAEPRVQRARCDAHAWPRHDRDESSPQRRPRREARRRARSRRLRRARRHRHRRGDERGDALARVRSVLQHQAARARIGSRTLDGAGGAESGRRPRAARERARPRHALRALLAARGQI